MTDEDGTAKVAELLKTAKIAMLTTVADDGTLMSRPMAVQEVEFDGDLWFFAESGSREVQQIAERPAVNAALASGSTWVSLAGSATEVRDDAKKRELWNAGVEAWLPQGPDSPEVTLIKVVAVSAEYWDTPGGRVATALSFAKAKLTGGRFEGGENARVDLG